MYMIKTSNYSLSTEIIVNYYIYYEILTYGYQHWEKDQLELMMIFKIMTGNNNYYYKPKTTQNKRTPEKKQDFHKYYRSNNCCV